MCRCVDAGANAASCCGGSDDDGADHDHDDACVDDDCVDDDCVGNVVDLSGGTKHEATSPLAPSVEVRPASVSKAFCCCSGIGSCSGL